MRRRSNELRRAEARWGSRDIFGGRRRRRIHWVPILVVGALAVGAFVLSDSQRRSRLEDLWADIHKNAADNAPQGGDQRSILPLPPAPPGID